MKILAAPATADRTTWLIHEFTKTPGALLLLPTEMARTNFVAAIERITADQSNRVRTFDEFLQGKLMGMEPSTVLVDSLDVLIGKLVASYVTRKPGIEITATAAATPISPEFQETRTTTPGRAARTRSA